MFKPKRIVIGCNKSQLIARLIRQKGHIVYTCDLQDADEETEFHIKGDLFEIINDGWDLGIFHPPCTYLTVANTYLTRGCSKYTAIEAKELQADAVEFFMKIARIDIEQTLIENPIGVMSSLYRVPDQIIQPYQFGCDASKATCLWLKNLPLLRAKRANYIKPRNINGLPRWGNQTDSGQNRETPSDERMNIRAKTYPGIAGAIADQLASAPMPLLLF